MSEIEEKKQENPKRTPEETILKILKENGYITASLEELKKGKLTDEQGNEIPAEVDDYHGIIKFKGQNNKELNVILREYGSTKRANMGISILPTTEIIFDDSYTIVGGRRVFEYQVVVREKEGNFVIYKDYKIEGNYDTNYKNIAEIKVSSGSQRKNMLSMKLVGNKAYGYDSTLYEDESRGYYEMPISEFTNENFKKKISEYLSRIDGSIDEEGYEEEAKKAKEVFQFILELLLEDLLIHYEVYLDNILASYETAKAAIEEKYQNKIAKETGKLDEEVSEIKKVFQKTKQKPVDNN